MNNTIEGNLGMLTRESYALGRSEMLPATFLLTNPYNSVRDNVASGSAGVGFWLRFRDKPEGEDTPPAKAGVPRPTLHQLQQLRPSLLPAGHTLKYTPATHPFPGCLV